MHNGQVDAKPAITHILRALIDEYGAELHLPAGDNAIARRIAEQAHIAHGTVLGILNGTPQRIAMNTGNKLAEFFNRVAIPKLQGEWLSSTSLDDFNNKRGAAGFVAVKIPTNYMQLVATVENWLCGVHIAYRYSLDSIDTGDVAREVVQIWREGPRLMHRMSFVPHSGRNDGPIYFFDGPVILVGRTAVLLGTNIGQQSRDRDRAHVIMLDHGDGDRDAVDCKLGLLTSTRPRQDLAPCTASTLLIRAKWDTAQLLDELIKTATTIRSLHETIRDDFGLGHETLIRVFLDNRPSGCPREPDLQAYEALIPEGCHDRVLRINTERFARNMKRVLVAALSDDSICAPYKPNWPPKMREMLTPA